MDIHTLGFALTGIVGGVLGILGRRKTIAGSNQKGALPVGTQERVFIVVGSLMIVIGIGGLVVFFLSLV